MPTIVSPWRTGSAGALGNALGWPVRKANREDVRPLYAGVVVNWGFSGPLFIRHDARLVNNPDAVAAACSKLYSLRLLNEAKVPCLEFSEDSNDALRWLEEGNSVVCRDLLKGRGGDGIRLINLKEWRNAGKPAPDFGQAKLFTRYFRKQKEVRVHVAEGRVLAIAEKRKRLGEPADYWIRSHSRGWIFAEARPPLGEADEVARRAVAALKLDFGAVDIGIDSNNACVVFEVNTAPGLEGRTLEAYVNYFRELGRYE